MENQIIFNAAEHKFVFFSNDVLRIAPEELRSENWYVKLQELDAKIHSTGREEKINFTDDRLVMVAHKAMCQVEFESPSLLNWWITYRYLEIYAAKDTPLIEELRRLINMYIGFTFSGAQVAQEQVAELEQITEQLKKVVFEDGYISLPSFVTELIENQGMPDEEEEQTTKRGRKKKEVAEEVEPGEFTEDERTMWLEMKEAAEVMLSDTSDLTEQEVADWKEMLETCELMLN